MLSTPLQEPLPDTYQHHPLAALRHLLADLNRLEQRYRYLLILDEYELLDDNPATTAEDFVTTLRGFTQQYPWLAVALVGLHTAGAQCQLLSAHLHLASAQSRAHGLLRLLTCFR